MNFKAKSQYETIDFLEDSSFRKWVNGQENKEWSDYEESDPSNKEEMIRAKLLLSGVVTSFESDKLSADQIEQRWNEFKKSNLQSTRQTKTNKTFQWKPWIAAASIVLLIGLGILIEKTFNSVELITIRTTNGELKNITLPDQSTIQLNANSILTYPSRFKDSAPREIELHGQAYLDIAKAKSPENRFVVDIAEGKIKVLGTRFTVTEYTEQTDVSLEEGKISFEYKNEEGTDQSVEMNPGDLLIRKSNGSVELSKNTNRKALSSWKTGYFEYQNTSLDQILRDLERQFSITLEVKDQSLLDFTLSGSLSATSLDESMSILRNTFSLTFDKITPSAYSISKDMKTK